MAQISLILMRTLSLWFGLHPLKFAIKTWNLKMGWVFVAPMSQTGRQTESEGWKLGLGQIWLEMWERATNQSTSRFTAIFTLLHLMSKSREKERNVKIWAWLQTIFNQPPPIGLLLLQACNLPPPLSCTFELTSTCPGKLQTQIIKE